MKNTLLDHFYTEISTTFSPENSRDFKCRVLLNSGHPIYKGHFAQIPVAPGVCLTQVIKEILMEKFQKELTMTHGDNIKFLAMINPIETPELEIDFSVKSGENLCEVSATYSSNGTTYVKFKGKFKPVE
jgi:3-hydroxyacyl-[acyl-carrier-protein] dehydratase